jgi:hypothetical protein
LNGIITTVHRNSGLVKRCNKCKSILYDTCPKKCSEQEGWGWDLRVSSKLYDGSGSIKMVLTKDIASRVLNRNLSELILLACQDKPLTQNLQQPFSVKIKIPESIEIVIDYTTENFEDIIHDYDAVFDTVAGDTYKKSFKVLKKGSGIIVSMLEQPNFELMNQYGVKALFQFTQVNRARLTN